MSDDGLESLAFAKRFKGWIATEVAAQLQRIAPRRRIAEVVSIDQASRRAGVVYVGETNEVSLPFNLAVPAYVGQYVAVDGPPQDRSIVDVLGASGVEQQIEENRAATPSPPYWAAPSLDVLETFPTRIRPLSASTEHTVSTGTMIVVPVRAQVDGTFARVAARVTVAGASSNTTTLSVYTIQPNKSMLLAAQATGVTSLATGTLVRDLDREIIVERNDMLAIGIHVAGSSTDPRFMSLAHTLSPLPLGTDFTVATLSVTTVPPAVDDGQLTYDFTSTPWAALLR